MPLKSQRGSINKVGSSQTAWVALLQCDTWAELLNFSAPRFLHL